MSPAYAKQRESGPYGSGIGATCGTEGRAEEEGSTVSEESESTGEESEARTLDALSADRRRKRDLLASEGIDPYPLRFDRTATAGELHQRHEGLVPDTRTGEIVRMAGRVTSIRGHGRLSFATLQDVAGSVQLLMQDSRLSEQAKVVLANADLGDWIGAEGEAVTSRRGELSVDVTELWLLSKALRPLPDKWHGLTATDTRYRQREIDLLANPDSRQVFDTRFKAVAALRRQLVLEDFVEVDTPILQPQAGGALARPFMTHSNALDIDLSLRIAPELYLKRLVVGGYERVFEIARNFRNEGIDTRHSPEIHRPRGVPGLRRRQRRHGPVRTAGGRGGPISHGTPLVHRRRSGDRPDPALAPSAAAGLVGRSGRPAAPSVRPGGAGAGGVRGAGVEFLPEWGSGKLIFELYDTIVLPTVVNPVFVVGFPVVVSPLARQTPDDPTMAARFELAIDAKEFANGYSELNIPEEQEARFQVEAAAAARGDLEAHPADLAFVRALEYGLPPTSGIGIGVDRLVMLLSEVEAIRDVILFPMLRPEATP